MRKLAHEMSNVEIEQIFDVDTGHHSVIQKGNVTDKYIYALQLWSNQKEVKVLRGLKNNPDKCTNEIFDGLQKAGGHTQTWEYAGKVHNDSNHWFVGTKPNENGWCTQIARLDIKNLDNPYVSNTSFPRLGRLNHTSGHYISSMTRVEAAVSPNYSYFLLAALDEQGTGYFWIYNLDLINDKLNEVENNEPDFRYVDMEKVKADNFFTIPNLYNAAGGDVFLNSIQGYDIDNNRNIYITSQQAPKIDKNTGKYPNDSDHIHHKQILKIPFNSITDSQSWSTLDLSKSKKFDIKGYHSEVESLQVTGENQGYLTVAYHAAKWDSKTQKYISYTYFNKIYKIKW